MVLDSALPAEGGSPLGILAEMEGHAAPFQGHF